MKKEALILKGVGEGDMGVFVGKGEMFLSELIVRKVVILHFCSLLVVQLLLLLFFFGPEPNPDICKTKKKNK